MPKYKIVVGGVQYLVSAKDEAHAERKVAEARANEAAMLANNVSKWSDKKSIAKVIKDIRWFISTKCLSNPSDVRRKPSLFSPTCVALAELEYQLVRLHDGNFHEISDEIERKRGL